MYKQENFTSRKDYVRSFAGKTVRIVIDRPIGYVHKKDDWSLTYPINYGYIPDTVSGDGEEADIYLLGISYPVEEYTAEVIGIVHRHNDCEDKLIAAPHGMLFTKEEIEKAVHFQERFFDSEIELFESPCEIIQQYNKTYSNPPERVRVAARAFIVRDGKLLLSHELNTGVYMSPGGGLEENETLEMCCAREVLEETGYIVRPIRKFFIVNEYSFETLYISHYYLCELVGEGEKHLTDIEIEHGIVPEWLPIEDALAEFGIYETLRDDHRSLYLREFTTIQKYKSLQ